MSTAQRTDPYRNFRYLVEIQGLIVGGFTEVTGLQVETEVEEYREGGINFHVHRFPKLTKHPNLTLKRGITDSDVLYRWHRDVVTGNFRRRTVSVIVLDINGDEKLRWNFTGAYPVKWVGPELKADNNGVAIESVEITHNGIVG